MENGKGEIKTEYEELLKIMEIEIKTILHRGKGKEKKSLQERNGIKDIKRDHKQRKGLK